MTSPLRASLLVSALTLLGTGVARAEDATDAARAKALFQEARALMAEARYREACPRFEESLELVSGLGTMFNLADCWEKTGRTGSAWALFRRVAATAEVSDQRDRARVAGERAAALEPRVTKLRITVATPTVRVSRNDEVVPEQALEDLIPVDPGTHRIAASSPGKEPWSTELEVPARGGRILVEVPPLKDAEPPPAVAPVPVEAPEKEEAPPPAPASTLGVSPARQRWGVVLGAVGVGATTAGVAFALQYRSSNENARGVCPESRGCTVDEVKQHAKFVDDARRSRALSFIGLGLGAAALTSAGLLYFWRTEQAPELEASAQVLPDGSWSAALGGHF